MGILACGALVAAAVGCGTKTATASRASCDGGGISDTGPAWSPDGRTIAFRRELARGIAIFSIPAAGGQAKRLTPSGRYGFLAWSPDSRRIALEVLRPSGRAQVVVLDARSGRQTTIARGDAAGGRPAFSPDGRSLAIVQSHGERRSIAVVSARGGTVRPLTARNADAFEPEWSPDGRRIAYVETAHGHGRIYLVDRSGAHRRPLTSDAAAAHVDQQRPVWSPDGRSVAFVAGAGPFGAAAELARVADGKLTRIAAGSSGYDVAFAPRGQALAFVAFGQDSESRLQVTRLRGTTKAVMVDTSGFEPSWSPDGKSLVLAHQTSRYPSRLRIAPVLGKGRMRRLTCQPT